MTLKERLGKFSEWRREIEERAGVDGVGVTPTLLDAYIKQMLVDAEADVRKRYCEAIRAACDQCDGDGFIPLAAIRKPPAESEAALEAAAEELVDDGGADGHGNCGDMQLDGHKCMYCGNNCQCNIEPDGQCLGCCQGGEDSCPACNECRDES